MNIFFIVGYAIIFLCILLVCIRSKHDNFSKLSLLVLFVLSIWQAISLINMNTGKYASTNSYVDSKAQYKNSQEILSNQEIIDVINQYFQIPNITTSYAPDIHYLQLDNSPELEIVVRLRENIDNNLFILKRKGPKWEVILKENNIQDYFQLKGNDNIVLVSYIRGVGTGISESNYLMYDIKSEEPKLIWQGVNERIEAKLDSNKIFKTIGIIEYINNKLLYKITKMQLEDSSSILNTTQQLLEYELVNGKFQQFTK